MPKVKSTILVWARETAGLSLENAVEKLQIRAARGRGAVDRLVRLERGDEIPTRQMLIKMAKQYRRPLLVFYMSAAPRKGDRGSDFRTLPQQQPGATNVLVDVLIRDVRARQSMVKAVLEDEGGTIPLSFIGSKEMSNGVPALLTSIKDTLGIDARAFQSAASVEDAFALLRSRAETAGVFVMLIGNLGSHHTAMDVESFRGFALADDIAPFVVINDQDAHQAWSFTVSIPRHTWSPPVCQALNQ